MKVGSLFSGIGGFEYGFKQAGMQISWLCEIDKYASKVLDKRVPGVPNYKDVKDVYTKVAPPKVDILCGGFPCQGLSIAGDRRGLEDPRSGLWFEFIRIIRRSSPTWVVVENVPGLLSSQGRRDFRELITSMDEFGYDVSWRVLDAQYFGVPQRRRRVFVVGHLGGRRSHEVLFERESPPGNSKTRPDKWHTDTRVVGTLSASGAGLSRAAGQRNELSFLIPVPTSVYQNYNSTVLESDTAYCLSAQSVKSGRSGLIRDRHGRLRRLMPVEAERLQGFPDGWTDVGLSDSQRYKQLGNAVNTKHSTWIAEQILRVENS